MLTFIFAALIIAAVIGMVSVIGAGSATIEFGKLVFCCAIVLVLISAVVGIVRGKARA